MGYKRYEADTRVFRCAFAAVALLAIAARQGFALALGVAWAVLAHTIVCSLAVVPPGLRPILSLSPMVRLLELFHGAVVGGSVVSWHVWWTAAAIGAVLLVGGAVHRRRTTAVCDVI